ncbi:chalcone isomerase family protein [Flavobacterium branchiarum]|uniref:Chalcone isomerase family protein n=1 Tax=Flavobacterium branchiarum TaxID=1114870 RepID=A0ABV5FP32_9FLAO|nr:chalcone isomerase family protein [Flavobacterium branchiarum]MDN3671808.1 chalcone isomerase family protein [Flavobacterium branchiarum]
MKKFLMLLTVISTLQFTNVYAQKTFTVEDVVLPRTIQFQNKTLSLNGAGGKSKIWLGKCIQSLYLTQLSQDYEYLMDLDTEMAIRINIVIPVVPPSKLTKLIYDRFEIAAENNIEYLRPRLEKLNNMLSGEIRAKDVFKFIYTPNDPAVWVYKNNILKGKIKGTDFKKAFFGIWLADKPADVKLRDQLLGK